MESKQRKNPAVFVASMNYLGTRRKANLDAHAEVTAANGQKEADKDYITDFHCDCNRRNLDIQKH